MPAVFASSVGDERDRRDQCPSCSAIGTDSKAGGPDYLPLHMLAKTVVERF